MTPKKLIQMAASPEADTAQLARLSRSDEKIGLAQINLAFHGVVEVRPFRRQDNLDFQRALASERLLPHRALDPAGMLRPLV